MKWERLSLPEKLTTALLVVVGIFLIAVSFVPDNKSMEQIFTTFTQTIGITILSSVSISFCEKISKSKEERQSDFQNSLLKILKGEEYPFEKLTRDELDRIAIELAKYRGSCDKQDELKNSIYKYEEKLLELCTDVYVSEYRNTTKVTPNYKNRQVFYKEIDEYIVRKNEYGKSSNFNIFVSLFIDAKQMEQIKKQSTIRDKIEKDKETKAYLGLLNVRKFRINNEDYIKDDSILKYTKIEDAAQSSPYTKKIKISIPLDRDKKEYIIECQFSYEIPITDTMMIMINDIACKKRQHKVELQPDPSGKKWQIDVVGYQAFERFKYNKCNNYCIDFNQKKDTVMIDTNEWLFPGCGYIFCFLGQN